MDYDLTDAWITEYEWVAEWTARRRMQRLPEDLPRFLGPRTVEEIELGPEEFESRVKAYCYAISMEGTPNG